MQGISALLVYALRPSGFPCAMPRKIAAAEAAIETVLVELKERRNWRCTAANVRLESRGVLPVEGNF